MSATVEKLDHNMAKITVEVAAEDFEKAIQQAYLRQRSRITIPGFRKGKAPRKLIRLLIQMALRKQAKMLFPARRSRLPRLRQESRSSLPLKWL